MCLAATFLHSSRTDDKILAGKPIIQGALLLDELATVRLLRAKLELFALFRFWVGPTRFASAAVVATSAFDGHPKAVLRNRTASADRSIRSSRPHRFPH
jgi:hypothetical protein